MWFCRIRLISVVAVVVGVVAGVVSAQSRTRESLSKPVHRIPNAATTASGSVASKTAPASVRRVGHAEESVTQTAAEAPKASGQVVAAGGQTASPMPPALAATKQELTVASRDVPTVKPPEPSPADTLNQAVQDAQLVLHNINQNIRDYVCQFVKRERVDGELQAQEHILLKVRNERVEQGQRIPFSVYMKFLAPRDVKNREVLFVRGENSGKLLAKEGGMRGRFLPSVWLEPTCSLAMKCNRYPITEVGFKRLTERLIESAQANETVAQCKVRYVKGATVDDRKCTYLEVQRDRRQPGPLGPNNIYRAQVFMDEDLMIPIRYAAYDWPQQPGGRPQVVEEYTYRNIRVNVGLTDKDFSKNNGKYKF